VAGVKRVWNDFGFKDPNGGRQGAIEGALEIFRGDAGLKDEAGDLCEGVNAGVGSSRALGQRGFAGYAVKGGLELALDGGISRLNLPTVKVGAVVGEGELPVLKGGGGFVQVIQWNSL
jgi:hypothetical protein